MGSNDTLKLPVINFTDLKLEAKNQICSLMGQIELEKKEK